MSATRHPALAVLVLAALGLLGWWPAASAAAAPAPPQLSIRVDDGQADARDGATLRYEVTVTNLGGRPLHDLVVSQTVPPGTTLTSVGSEGRKGKDGARWTVDVAAGKSVTLTSAVAVGKDLPPDLLRLATVACAATSARTAPLVCGSDSDQLPAGAAAAQQQHQVETTATTGGVRWVWPAAAVVGALLVLALLALAVGRTVRSRRDARSAEAARLARRGAGAEQVTGPEPGAREVVQR